ncbi:MULTISPECIES: aminotransferase class IV family protein [Streptomyces]|jgi:branched-subunit amino acid aminotransferase/4-amino-4-deoxychorismate lyase|uniref:aminotransferase class IV family protein n=1 Tax=Streptomyces TaxID=1883 RepID=UPI0008322AD1|nr:MULTISPECIES: aminotransferase class IV family protein [Streptomyces]MDN5385281.1 aminotransferase class IV family protein [Streptomyces sp. LB8]
MAELNGRPVIPDDLLTLALTNYGHFTSMRVDNQRVRGLGLHLERLVRDCRAVFGADLDPEKVRHYVRQATSDLTGSFVVRVTVFDPAVELAHPDKAKNPSVLVTVRPAADLPLPPLRVKSVRYERDVPAVKHSGLFGALHARRAALLDGFDDALFIGPDDRVSEGGTWNVGFIGEEGVVWPKADILPGVTMALLQQIGQQHIAPVTLADAQGMRAAFATNTTIGVRAISAIDDVPMATEHPVLTKLRDAYLAIPGERL